MRAAAERAAAIDGERWEPRVRAPPRSRSSCREQRGVGTRLTPRCPGDFSTSSSLLGDELSQRQRGERDTAPGCLRRDDPGGHASSGMRRQVTLRCLMRWKDGALPTESRARKHNTDAHARAYVSHMSPTS
ncbi:unnamed protein product [Lampetra planeri]